MYSTINPTKIGFTQNTKQNKKKHKQSSKKKIILKYLNIYTANQKPFSKTSMSGR